MLFDCKNDGWLHDLYDLHTSTWWLPARIHPISLDPLKSVQIARIELSMPKLNKMHVLKYHQLMSVVDHIPQL